MFRSSAFRCGISLVLALYGFQLPSATLPTSRVTAPASPSPKLSSGPAGSPLPGWVASLFTALGLGWLTWLAYSNSFTAGLVLDNRVMITVDPRVREWSRENLQLVFTKDYWWPFYASDLYRPLTTLSYLFNYAVLGNGEKVAGYHVVNYLLHWANVWLIFLIVRRLSGRRAWAALAAALFAVHPVNVESVTNIVGRADLLATLSILSGGWFYLRAAGVAGWRKIPWLIGLGLMAAWGVLAKESAVMICAFVLLYDWLWRWPALPGETLGARLGAALREFFLKGYVALAPALLLLFGARHWLVQNSPVFGQVFVDNPIAYAPPFAGFMTAILVLGRYLGLLLLPVTLSSDYSYNQIPLYGEGGVGEMLEAWVALALVAGLLVSAVRRRRSDPLYAWGVLFFFLMILPTSNLVVSIGSIMAERFLYLPSIGFCVVAARVWLWLGEELAKLLWPGSSRRWAVLVPLVVLVALGARTHARNQDWQDDLSLWQSAVHASPNSFKAHKGYANAIFGAQHDEATLDIALARSQQALAILDQKVLPEIQRDDTLYQDLGLFYRTKGDFLAQRGEPDQAASYYKLSLDVLLKAQAVDEFVNRTSREAGLRRGRAADEIPVVGNFRIYGQLGMTYAKLSDWRGMEEAGQHAQLLNPEEPIGYLLAATACFNSNRPLEAARKFAEALFIDPNDVSSWQNLDRCLVRLGIQPSPIVPNPPSYSLRTVGDPRVQRLINEASHELAQNFAVAKRPDGVRTVRDRAVQAYGVPASVFDDLGKF